MEAGSRLAAAVSGKAQGPGAGVCVSFHTLRLGAGLPPESLNSAESWLPPSYNRDYEADPPVTVGIM